MQIICYQTINYLAESKCFPHFLETLFHFSSLFLGAYRCFSVRVLWCCDSPLIFAFLVLLGGIAPFMLAPKIGALFF